MTEATTWSARNGLNGVSVVSSGAAPLSVTTAQSRSGSPSASNDSNESFAFHPRLFGVKSSRSSWVYLYLFFEFEMKINFYTLVI